MKKNTKKWLIALLSSLTLILLVACSGQKKSHFQSLNTDEGYDNRVTYFYQKEEITKMELVSTVLYSNLGTNSKKDAKKILKTFEEFYTDIKGTELTLSYKEDRVILSLTVDYKKFKYKEGFTAPGFLLKDDQTANTNLKENKEAIKELGFTEVKDEKFKNLK